MDARTQLAIRVVELARTEVLAQNPFFAAAVGRVPFALGTFARPLATDGAALGIDAERVLGRFAETGEPPAHDVLHALLHCILLHPFSAPGRDERLWNLACDICAERIAAELCGPREGPRGVALAAAISTVETRCSGSVSAQRLYRLMMRGEWERHVERWEELFAADDHAPWWRETPMAAYAPEGAQAFDPDAPATDSGESGEVEEGASVGREVDEGDDGALREEWKRIARALKVEAQALQRVRGTRIGSLVEEVEAATSERVDYASWLRQFAAMGEHLRISDEEFDPVLYTFGLSRYGNLPLIEPLEQREERRIREFVIVIDTSQSVSGDAVRRFVDETCSILQSGDAFADQVQVRVIQCDAQVQADDIIDDARALEEWGRALELRGFGGTDFRPAFEYVDGLVAEGAFRDLGGLVYFTDGWGVYPDYRPGYPVAFAFYDDDHRAEDVPPWAVQVVLNPER